MPITVLVAEEHPVYRLGLVCELRQRSEIKVVGAADRGTDAMSAVRELRPDVLVLAMDLEGLKGESVIRSVAAEELPTRVLVVSAHVDRPTVYGAVSAGAAGYLSKRADADVIARAIEQVAEGHTVLEDEAQEALATEIRGRSTNEEPLLSPREIEILKLLADGFTTAAAAKELYLSAATIKTHLHRAFGKLGVPDRTAAVAEALRRGLFE